MRSAVALLLVLFLVPAGSQAEQSSAPIIPTTPAGNALSAWLEAFNDGSKPKYLSFLEKWMPSRVAHIQDGLEFRAMTGGFDLRGIEASTPTTISAVLESRNDGQYARVELTVTAKPPYEITTFPIVAIHAVPPQFAPAHLPEAQLIEATRLQLDQASKAGRFSGAVLIAKNGVPAFEAAYGLANRATSARNTVNTRFNLGSMNKMFTGTAVLQLVQAGKVQLNAVLGTYLPNYPNKDLASHVTIAELLTHTGGTGDFFGPEFDAHRLQLRALSDYETLFGARGTLFKPGDHYQYSNYGYILLGLVIETASGEDYYSYVKQHIFAQAGMTSTGSEPLGDVVPDTAIGYMRDDKGKLQANTDMLGYRGLPAGGGYSTVVDMLRFANALTAHRLLNERYTDLLTTGKVHSDPDALYAYGFDDSRFNGVRCFGHSGGGPGINGELEICPNAGYVVAALGNLDPPSASTVADFITNRLPTSTP